QLRLRGPLRALPDAARRPDRGRLRLAAAARLAARPGVAAPARGGPASQAPAVGVHPRPLLADDPADRGAAQAGAVPRAARPAWRRRPAPLRDRLPPLGLRLARPRAAGGGAAHAAPPDHGRERPRLLPSVSRQPSAISRQGTTKVEPQSPQ